MLAKNTFTRVSAVALYVALQTVLLYGQFESGSILGTIRDPSGSSVPSAIVTLENVGKGVTVKASTDNNGNYEFVNQRVGAYRVRVEAPGFQTSVTDPFDLAVNARQRVDLTLKVGEATQSVTVRGAAVLLETDTSSRGQVINPKQIVNLPLNGRSYADLNSTSTRCSKIISGKPER